MRNLRLHTIRIFALLLFFLCGTANPAWAAKVTYHILTLPINPSVYDYHMKGTVTGHRLEALKIVVDNHSTVALPPHYQSPLATGFTYYEPKDITIGGSAISLYDGDDNCKGVLYDVKGDATPVAPTKTITDNTAEYYVVYTYNESNTIAKLDGSVNYNISVKNLGFLSLNRGRNNRPAVVKKDQVDPEMLASDDFSYIASPGNSITTYWQSGDNKNKPSDTQSKFFFIFKFEGEDPYHIVVRTSYNRDITYIEKNDDNKKFVYKWYKGGALFASGTGNVYIASDDHIRYTSDWVDGDPNPTNPAYETRTGNFHGNKSYWSTVALLNNTSNTGYVFMGTRTVNNNGAVPGPKDDTKYYYLKFTGNNLNYGQITSTEATNSHTMDGIYPLKKVTFKIATPFYAAEQTTAHIVSVADWVSQYTVDNEDIVTKYLPTSLLRKYCTLTGKFYSDAACTNEITRFSQADYDNTEGYKVYIGYQVDAGIPFKAITPAASYSASTWAGATWYELTDDGSVQESGRKIKWNDGDPSGSFKNNGANGEYVKESEFAFVGDPYELQVVHRSQTSGSTPYYVGSTLNVSRTANVLYGTNYEYFEPAGAQTMTFHVNGFTADTGNKYKVLIGGTDDEQVTSITPASATELSSSSADVTVTVNASGGAAKTFTVTITETKGDGTTTVGTPTVITVHQSKVGYSWNIPYDETAGSFLLRKFNDTGNWYWNAGHPSPVAISYSTKAHTYNVATANAQTVTFNVSNLGYTEGDYILVTAGGTDASQVTVSSEKFHVQSGGTASFTAAIKGRGDGDKHFTLSIQKYNSSNVAQGTASVVTVNQNNSNIVANTVSYSTSNSTRVKVMTLPTRSFTYNIVDKSGRIAVKATTTQTIFSPLSLASIPSIIVSPYLYGETVTFYSTYTGGGRGNLSSPITELTAGNAASSTNIYVKYTTSALNAKPINLSEDLELNVKLNGYYIYYDKTENVLKTNDNPTVDDLNSSIYLWKLRNRDPYAMLIDNMGAREDLEVNDQSETPDIYDDNGTKTNPSRQKGAWLKLSASLGDAVGFTFVTDRANAQQFIAKSSLQQGVYEVMVADGGSVDASTTYYDIACPEADVVKIYNNTTYAHGHDVLRFVLNQNVAYTYHLIDKAKHELLTADSKTPDLALPAEFQSPLVATYNFYARDQITIDESKTPHEYTPINPATKITNLSGLNATYTIYDSSEGAYSGSLTATDETDMKSQADKLTSTGDYYYKIGSSAPYTYKKVTVSRGYQGTHIYVTYDINDVVTFNTAQYMLKFLNPLAEGYHLEDGNDKLTSDKIQAVYPYCNGDGNMNVYGAAMQNEQFNGGANTRPRWVWYFDSNNKDPYHVKIRSKSTIKYKDVSHYTYLTTHVVQFKQDDTKHVVTGGALPTIASIDPTEYMVLGSKNNYKLLTTNTIDDGTTNVRRSVTSLEQYWKTYNMIKLDVLGIAKSTDAYSDDASTWVVPEGKRAELKSKLVERLKLTATNDDNLTEKIEALTSTGVYYFRVGTSTYTYKKVTLTQLADNSDPLNPISIVYTTENCFESDWGGSNYVDGWIWHSYNAYANATRWNGYNDKTDGHEKKVVENLEHWYQTFNMGDGTFDIESADIPPVLVLLDRHGWEIMRRPLPPATTYPEGEELAGLRAYDSPLVDKYYFYSNATKASGCHKYTMRLQDGKERDQIKVNGERYSSTSLGDLPPKTATGVVSGGAIQDFYVTYTVKEEYESKYAYNLVYTETKDGDKVTGYTVTSETGTSQPYLVLQNGRFYKAENTIGTSLDPSYFTKPISEHTNPEGGNVYDLIVSPHNHGENNNDIIDGSGNFIGNNFWLIKPNLNIDEEMGIKWGTAISGAEPLSKAATQVTYKDKSGFDPYNIQLQLVKNNKGEADGRYLTTHMTSAHLEDGILIGDYEGGSKMITLATAGSATVDEDTSEGYDHTDMRITNQTFMAVSDANGNMQLMPRFDHTKRINVPSTSHWLTTLENPVDHALANVEVNTSMGPQTAFFVSPQRFHYHIIDNNGREALAYKRGADSYPAITDHFKSPMAKDFTYYRGLAVSETPAESSVEAWGAATGEFKKSLTNAAMLTDAVKLLPTAGTYQFRMGTRGVFTYKSVIVTKGLTEQQITGSFAAAELSDVDNDVYVRYSYDEDADHDGDNILLGKWFTVELAEKDLQANGTLIYATGDSQGTGINLYAGNESTLGNDNDKPATIDANAKKWQWKFFVAPADPTSDYYVEPDPYAIHLFNRQANHTTNPSLEPSPMSVAIKVPNENTGADRFALLKHPSDGYALVVAKTYDRTYNYQFLNGASMTVPDAGTPQAATTAGETNFNYKAGTLTTGSKVMLNDDVEHTFTYNVITNAGKLAITAEQDNNEAESHSFDPYLPESAQSPLLNMDDYLYYGFASRPNGDYSVIPQTKLYTLYGLYDDVVYVRYNPYDVDKTPFKVPNKRNNTGTGQVERNSGSVDASMNINGGLPYNIVWYTDNMMQSTDDAAVSDGGSHALSGNKQHIWYFTNNDPYALKIKHKGGKFLDGSTTMVEEASAPTFMLLRKDGYDYGILQLTGTTGADAGKKLTGYGGALTADASTNPTKYIIFGLSIHNLIYHLVIAKSCPKHDDPKTGEYVDIDYRETVSGTLGTKRIFGTTQRDLTSIADPTLEDLSPIVGSKYQLGKTLSWNGEAHTYSYDAGSVSIGDDLVLPTVFYRPNCLFDFYVEGIYRHYAEANDDEGKPYSDMETKYKGLKLDKLMSDEGLIDQTVVINVIYKFNPGLETNAGGDFVTEMKEAGTHYLWYTFETADATPQLAHYTHVRGMRAESGRALHYTNDYLWSPLGDPYGFKSYNRYVYKNNAGTTKVLTSTALSNNQPVVMETPGENSCTSGNEIYELLPSSTPESGNFRVHPLLNTDNTLFLRIKEDENPAEDGKLILSDDTPVQEWTYGLSTELLNPYYQGAGNVGGLNATGKTAYENAQTEHASDPFRLITELQKICYSNTNIVPYSAGYYRLCNQPGASSLSTQRYASGYLHEIEKTAVTSDTPIPMHFYSKKGVTGSFAGDTNPLTSGFTETAATRGEIPIPATEYDPSTIFQFTGTKDAATMQTQGLYVKGVYSDEHNGYAKMTSDSEDATSFHVDDIGGAVVIIYNLDGSTRRYINYGQNASIYDLKYYENVDVDGSKWCMEPASTQNLKVATNNGGDGYYYATFYAPFDVQLPADALDGTKTYNAYTCKTWDNAGLHPTAVPAATVNAVEVAEGKFVPANTPVILRVKDESGSVTLTLPTASPTASSITTDLIGTYLEQLLEASGTRDVYTLGVPMTSSVSKDGDYSTTGKITAPLPEFATTGVGFYINATPNKEADPKQASWQRNNRYVLHNKIYYRAAATPPGRELDMESPEFVPVIFDFDGEEEEGSIEEGLTPRMQGDNHVYDLSGRCVATPEQVADGSWWQNLSHGIYILNGKKIRK